MKNRTQNESQIDLFLDPLWRCLATSILGRYWGPFGVHFGTILGSKIGLKAIVKNIKKMIEKKSRNPASDLRKTSLWSPKGNQSDWLLADGNWQLATGRPAGQLGTRDTSLVPRGHGGGYVWRRLFHVNLPPQKKM